MLQRYVECAKERDEGGYVLHIGPPPVNQPFSRTRDNPIVATFFAIQHLLRCPTPPHPRIDVLRLAVAFSEQVEAKKLEVDQIVVSDLRRHRYLQCEFEPERVESQMAQALEHRILPRIRKPEHHSSPFRTALTAERLQRIEHPSTPILQSRVIDQPPDPELPPQVGIRASQGDFGLPEPREIQKRTARVRAQQTTDLDDVMRPETRTVPHNTHATSIRCRC